MFGSERIGPVGIDEKTEQVVTRGWEKEAARLCCQFSLSSRSVGVERVIYTDVSREPARSTASTSTQRAKLPCIPVEGHSVWCVSSFEGLKELAAKAIAALTAS